MDRSKLLEYFDASNYSYVYNVVGCGAIGSHVCEELARLGFTNIHLYDFDTVDAHNITNQMFMFNDIRRTKVETCAEMMKSINPEIAVVTHELGLTAPYILNGIIILCVDNIDLRRRICQANRYNPYCKAVLDFRMRLTDAQHYFADWSDDFQKATLLDTMDFTHDEAKQATPLSACGVELNVIYTVKTITAFGMANLVNYLLGDEYKTMIIANMKTYTIDAFKAKPRKKKTPAWLERIVNITTATQ